LAIETTDENAENSEQRIKRRRFYEKNGFRETGYVVKRKSDSFDLMLIGNSFHIDELYTIFKEVDWLSGTLTAWLGKKQIRKKE
jgi:hypothetical protein